MSKAPANYGKRVEKAVIRSRILSGLDGGKFCSASTLGYLAFPEYKFRSPQGAAFAVAKTLRDLTTEGWVSHQFGKGYYLCRPLYTEV